MVWALLLSSLIFLPSLFLVDPWVAANGPRLQQWWQAIPGPIAWMIHHSVWLFYLLFLARAMIALWRRDRAELSVLGAYIFVELLIAFLLVRVLKISLGRPRPFVGVEAWNTWSL